MMVATQTQSSIWLRGAKAAMVFGIAFLVGAMLLVLLALRIASRLSITPQELSSTVSEAVIVTLRNGTDDQKLQTIRALETLGANAKPFSAALVAAAKASNPEVCSAAQHALKMINQPLPENP